MVKEERAVAIVDRMESGTAVLELIEPQYVFEFPAHLLPDGVNEGSAVEISFEERPEIEESRRQRIRDLQQTLLEQSDTEEMD